MTTEHIGKYLAVETVKAFIARENLLDKDAFHLLALSGGADSVALLLIMLQLGYKIEAVHCNFHLRGEESNRDENFAKRLCEKLGIAFHIAHFDTEAYAHLHKISIETAARDLRYNYFERLRKDIGATDICVAHHRDDNVETIIMNLIRGGGIRGIAGMKPKNGKIARPLLCISRKDIEHYLAQKEQDYIIDSTNLKTNATRNKIRLEIIPALEGINPKASWHIQQMAEHLIEAEKIIDDTTNDAIKRIITPTNEGAIVNVDTLKNFSSPHYLLYTILENYGFPRYEIQKIYTAAKSNATGKTFFSPTHQLLIDRQKIIIECKSSILQPLTIQQEGYYLTPCGRHLRINFLPIDAVLDLHCPCNEAYFDANKVTFPLILRPAINGDRFCPFGMKGTKTVNTYLTDIKKTLFEKRNQMVLIDASGKIMWLVGERSDNRFRITCATQNVIHCSWGA